MGLDMYLYTNSKKLTEKVHENAPYGSCITDFYKKDGVIMYWRKANAVHAWFVRNIQVGEDDCREYEVEVDELVRLHDECRQVLDSTRLVDGKVSCGKELKRDGWHDIMQDGKVLEDTATAEDVMPTCGGLFFGSCDYDEYYWDELARTVEELGRIIDMLKPADDRSWRTVLEDEPDWYVKFYYRSNW